MTWDLEKEVLPIFTQGTPWPDAQGNKEVWWLFDDGAQSQPNQKLFAPFFAALEKKKSDNDTKAFDTAVTLIQFVLEGSKGVSPLISDGQDAHPLLIDEIIGEKGPYWIVTPPIETGGRREALEAELAALEANPFPPLELAVGIQEGGVEYASGAHIQRAIQHVAAKESNFHIGQRSTVGKCLAGVEGFDRGEARGPRRGLERCVHRHVMPAALHVEH